MISPAMITIRGTQHNVSGPEAGSDPTTVELVTEGACSYHPDFSQFTYQESELTGMAGTTTTFRVEKEQITMLREGTVTSQMLFQPGKKNTFLYETPFGTMTMGVDTRRLKVETGENGGKLDLQYNVDVDGIPLSRNTFLISWKPQVS